MPHSESERGDTLVEVLITVVIVGLVAAAILGALLIAISSSTEHRNLANDDSILKSAIEAVKVQAQLPQSSSNKFQDCGTTSGPPTLAAITLPTVPSGYSVAITSVQCWDAKNHVFDSTCTAGSTCNPSGLLLVTLTVQDPTGYKISESSLVRDPTYVSSYSGSGY